MEPRSKRHRKNIKQKDPFLTIGLLTVIVVAAFAGLIYWLGQMRSAGGDHLPLTSTPPSQTAGQAASPPSQKEPKKEPVENVKPPGIDGAASSPAQGTSLGNGTGTGSTAVTATTPSSSATAGSTTAVGAPGPAGGQPVSNSVKLAFVGDVMMASKVEDVLKANGFDYPYRELTSELLSPDLTIANFESPVTTEGKAEKKDFVYRTSPVALPDFVKAGFDVVNLANNHILDYGTQGLLDTLQHLGSAGLKYVGAGRNIEEAYKPAIIESKGIKIAFLGFSRVAENQSWYATVSKPGVAQTYVPQRAIQAIQSAREQADLVVVFAHWGKEREDKPVKEQTQLAKQYIDNGADLVVASHPHVMQGFESYNGKWIAYSLGNFLFTTNADSKTWETAILNATCTKEGTCNLDLVPVWNQYAKLTKMSEPEGLKLFKRLSDISVNAEVDTSGSVKVKQSPQSQVKR